MSRRRRSRRSSGKLEPKIQKRMLINVVDPEEIRVAIMDGDKLEGIYLERTGSGFHTGNIYKGRVQNIEPSLQAAFVDIGGQKNGFLHVSDVIPPDGGYRGVLKKKPGRAPSIKKGMPIEKMLWKGQELLVQITRETLGEKGPSLTTYISFPGRYLVLMPAVIKKGVSKKIRSDEERRQLLSALNDLNPPDDMGYIIRTAGMNRGRDELKKDLDYLQRLWKAIIVRTKKAKLPSLIYEESDLAIRAVRDFFQDNVDELIIDQEESYNRLGEFLDVVMPNYADRARLYTENVPLFHHYGVDDEIEKVLSRRIELKSGGSIVIEPTEAMVSIDVNSGRSNRNEDSREMILKANMEAAEEIARQLRLRDLGGLVMVDFIDMENLQDRKDVEKHFREALRPDRARLTLLPISQLGVLEMTRQRMRKSLRSSVFTSCPYCGGLGTVKEADSVSLDFVRQLRQNLSAKSGVYEVRLHPKAASYVGNRKRREIGALESEFESSIFIKTDMAMKYGDISFRMLEDGEKLDFD